MKRNVTSLAGAIVIALGIVSLAFFGSGAVVHAQPFGTVSAGFTTHTLAADGTCYQYGCDGKPVQGSTCQQDGQKIHGEKIYSKIQPSQLMFVFSVYTSSSCGATWSVITNESGGSLTNATASIRRSLPNENVQTTGPVTLANGASAYSPMLGMVEPQDTMEAWVSADDLDGKTVLYSHNYIYGGGHG